MSGFNTQEWNALSDKQRIAMRELYTKVHRSALAQMELLREAAQNLSDLDDQALESTNAILGGEENVMRIFGVKNPVGCDEGTEVDEYTQKDGSKIQCVSTISFEDLLESTEERADFLKQFKASKTFFLPQEGDATFPGPSTC